MVSVAHVVVIVELPFSKPLFLVLQVRDLPGYLPFTLVLKHENCALDWEMGIEIEIRIRIRIGMRFQVEFDALRRKVRYSNHGVYESRELRCSQRHWIISNNHIHYLLLVIRVMMDIHILLRLKEPLLPFPFPSLPFIHSFTRTWSTFKSRPSFKQINIQIN